MKVEKDVAPFTFSVHGSVVHLVSTHLDPTVDENNNGGGGGTGSPDRRFLNWYVYDSTEAVRNARLGALFHDEHRKEQICREVFHVLDDYIPTP